MFFSVLSGRGLRNKAENDQVDPGKGNEINKVENGWYVNQQHFGSDSWHAGGQVRCL